MWPIIFIIALIPLFFAWSDSILGFFPQLNQYLPESKKQTLEKPALSPENNPEDPAYVPPKNSQWTEQSNEAGFVAWAMSLDGSYRLTVGCAPNQVAILSLETITEANGALSVQQVNDVNAVLNYSFGVLPTPNGQASGTELTGAVAQFGKIKLEHQSGAPTYARFQLDTRTSQNIARTLSTDCLQE